MNNTSPTEAASMKATDLLEGHALSVLLCWVMCTSALATTCIHGVIERTTDKAVMLRVDGGRTLWLPRRALVKLVEDWGTAPSGARQVYGRRCRLAKWFKPDGAARDVLMRVSSTGFVAAA